MSDALRVTAPASSANLGPGFDSMALALDLRNEVVIEPADGVPPQVEVTGEGVDEAPQGRGNLFLRAFVAGGGDPAGLRFRMRNRVPFARGLGSSAATIVAGLAAADAWREHPHRDLLGLAAELEGHPDNVAAALNGGMTLAWTGPHGPSAIGFGVPEVSFVVVVPEQRLSTAAARAALPAEVPHADAVHTATRAALLVAAIGSADAELLRDALDDRLHEPYRAPLAPLLAAVRERVAGNPAVYGATLSGAGPSVLVWCEPDGDEHVAKLVELPGASASPLAVAEHGVSVD
ncbi:MAG TPA: homoserine kinase [Gaiellales bacterium]|nr:homoserine kinase [Gaiellales bacterium]